MYAQLYRNVVNKSIPMYSRCKCTVVHFYCTSENGDVVLEVRKNETDVE